LNLLGRVGMEVEDANGDFQNLTVVFGFAARPVTTVIVEGSGAPRPLALSPVRAFAAVVLGHDDFALVPVGASGDRGSPERLSHRP
jgi:hypothetical protein